MKSAITSFWVLMPWGGTVTMSSGLLQVTAQFKNCFHMMRTREMAQWVKYFLCKHEDLCWVPSTHIKASIHCNPSAGQWKTNGSFRPKQSLA